MIFVDTNILVDVVTNNPEWQPWSQRQLEAAALRDRLVINSVVYAELSIGYEKIEEVDAVLATVKIAIAEIPRIALFVAGRAFKQHRGRGATRTRVLPDFFIGAHALVLDALLITRDAKRYRTYFPTLNLIAPN
jgi:hypothetical protein